MSRKHFYGLAYALHDSKAPLQVINAVADFCATQNGRFDRGRFVRVATEGKR